ncbi:MAG TPA: hypothetical protein VF746_03775 [Longimicrobium sp.]|jgi:hypothetical protein
MRTLDRRSAFVTLLVLAAWPAAAPAQETSQRLLSRLQPYAGLSVGAHNLPEGLQGCSKETYPAGELRAGVALGAVALEGRAGVLADPTDCMVEVAGTLDPFVPTNGVYTSREPGFGSDPAGLAADVRVRLGGTPRVPLSLSAGAGWLSGPDVPYLTTGVGLRTPGRIRLTLEAEMDWYHVEFTDVTREWQNSQVVREISRVERDRWWRGVGLRAGVELGARR